LGDAGEVGRIAAAVIDGVKILRIQDLMAEAAAGPTGHKGLVGKLLGFAKAEGVVGVDIHEGNHAWQSHVIEFFAIGTAVLPLEKEIAPEKIPDPIMVLSVND
jgi:hypothetical protein